MTNAYIHDFGSIDCDDEDLDTVDSFSSFFPLSSVEGLFPGLKRINLPAVHTTVYFESTLILADLATRRASFSLIFI